MNTKQNGVVQKEYSGFQVTWEMLNPMVTLSIFRVKQATFEFFSSDLRLAAKNYTCEYNNYLEK